MATAASDSQNTTTSKWLRWLMIVALILAAVVAAYLFVAWTITQIAIAFVLLIFEFFTHLASAFSGSH